jgi:prefoldin subunit 5
VSHGGELDVSLRDRAKQLVGTRREVAQLRRDVDQLQEAVEEYRRLNERLSDVLDIVEELLVPAVDRDEEKLRALLAKI